MAMNSVNGFATRDRSSTLTVTNTASFPVPLIRRFSFRLAAKSDVSRIEDAIFRQKNRWRGLVQFYADN